MRWLGWDRFKVAIASTGTSDCEGRKASRANPLAARRERGCGVVGDGGWMSEVQEACESSQLEETLLKLVPVTVGVVPDIMEKLSCDGRAEKPLSAPILSKPRRLAPAVPPKNSKLSGYLGGTSGLWRCSGSVNPSRAWLGFGMRPPPCLPTSL